AGPALRRRGTARRAHLPQPRACGQPGGRRGRGGARDEAAADPHGGAGAGAVADDGVGGVGTAGAHRGRAQRRPSRDGRPRPVRRWRGPLPPGARPGVRAGRGPLDRRPG
ncbi:MAG: Transcriptional regulator, GntR family domain / Aspartate aminotransferase, partial [uncultured Nocardioidaceae bacterium]